MTRALRSAAVAALAAVAAVAAIIAADFAPPAGAQSDEGAGRIVARLLEDGRLEFGWQPSGGTRTLPTKRYFPADVTHNRWLRSSPVEVDGAEIGKIEVRQSEDGRIEFAFTPTDGERILTDARYFPPSARVGRWLRSTQITIMPATPRFTAASAGTVHTCAIRESGAIACWGNNDYGQIDAPEGNYTVVNAGGWHTCAIRSDNGAIACWGWNEDGQTDDAPEGSYTAVSADGWHTCAIRSNDSAIACWGLNGYPIHDDDTGERRIIKTGQTDAPPGSYIAVSAGIEHTCAIRESGAIACWGWNRNGETDAPPGSYTAVSVGSYHTCAIHKSGEIACWGWNEYGQTDAPEGNYTAVSADNDYACAIRDTGEIACWGRNRYGATDAPAGSYTAVSAGLRHACAIRRGSGEIACWGWNDSGQATPPAD